MTILTHNQWSAISTRFYKLWVVTIADRHGWQLAVFITGALLVGALAMWMLMSVPTRFRKPIVMAVTFLGGLILALEFLISTDTWHPLTDFLPAYGNVQMVIGSFALLLGLVNLFMIHAEAVNKRTRGWINSFAFFVAFFAIMIAGFVKDYAAAKAVSGSADSIYTVFFEGFLMPLSSTMFSMIAFYIASAAYRAFRIRSTESALMMITASIIMLGLVPAGQYLTSGLPGWLYWLRLENVSYWLLTSPNMAVQRAMAFGIAVGALATGLRIWLSLERGSFFDRQL